MFRFRNSRQEEKYHMHKILKHFVLRQQTTCFDYFLSWRSLAFLEGSWEEEMKIKKNTFESAIIELKVTKYSV